MFKLHVRVKQKKSVVKMKGSFKKKFPKQKFKKQNNCQFHAFFNDSIQYYF